MDGRQGAGDTPMASCSMMISACRAGKKTAMSLYSFNNFGVDTTNLHPAWNNGGLSGITLLKEKQTRCWVVGGWV